MPQTHGIATNWVTGHSFFGVRAQCSLATVRCPSRPAPASRAMTSCSTYQLVESSWISHQHSLPSSAPLLRSSQEATAIDPCRRAHCGHHVPTAAEKGWDSPPCGAAHPGLPIPAITRFAHPQSQAIPGGKRLLLFDSVGLLRYWVPVAVVRSALMLSGGPWVLTAGFCSDCRNSSSSKQPVQGIEARG